MKKTNSYLQNLLFLIKQRKGAFIAIVVSSTLLTGFNLALPVIVQSMLDNQVLTLTAKPWYETDDITGAVVDGKYYTQDPDAAEDTHASVIYDNDDNAYLITDIPEGTAIAKFEDNIAYGYDNQIVKVTFTKLSRDTIFELYKPSMPGLSQAVMVYSGIAISMAFFAWINNIYVRRFSRKTIADMRIRGFAKLQKLPIDYFTQRQDGKFISYLISDVGMWYSLASNIGVQLLQAVLTFIGIYFMLARLDIRLFLGALCLLPFIALWIYVFRRKVTVYYEKARSSSSALNALLNEQFKGISVIRAFSYTDEAGKEFTKLNEEVYDYNVKTLKMRAFLTGSIVNVLRRLMWLAIIIFAGSVYFNSGKAGLTIGLIYLLVSYVNYYVEPLYQLFGVLMTIEQANVSIQRYFRYMYEDEEQEKPDAITTSLPRFTGAIDFVNLNFGYNAENQVLHNINLHVSPGQTVAIVGHTGSGKSSLMNLLMRFYDYKEGKILVDGREIIDMTRHVYREHVGIILQDPVLFKGTLLDAVTWGDNQFTEVEIAEILRVIGAGELLDHPDGLQQMVNEMGSNFSLGQRQLIAFARAIIQNPSILILDEATANIDTETERKIQEALKYAAKGRTTFIIAHRLSTIKDADLIVVLDKGRIIEQGNHGALIANKSMYYEMYQAQAKTV